MKMEKHIPFAFTQEHARLCDKHYSDSECVRVPLYRAARLKTRLRKDAKIWIDPCLDGFPRCDPNSDLWTYMSDNDGAARLMDINFVRKPEQAEIDTLVNSLLDRAHDLGPDWLTVPQLPQADDTAHNRINKQLAKATGEWKHKNRYQGKMIFPLVFTHQRQLDKKTSWGPKLKTARRLFDEARADGLWIVDSSLSDSKGTSNFETKRFPELIRLHDFAKESFPAKAIHVAGPYWGMNLVLWARGLVTHTAIGVGGGYQYYLPGGPKLTAAKAKVALTPLRRTAIADTSLQGWLKAAMKSTSPTDRSHQEFKKLSDRFDTIILKSKEQISGSYRSWLETISGIPEEGRALALYQDLSAAFVLGKQLSLISGESGNARRPSVPARQLMMSCL